MQRQPSCTLCGRSSPFPALYARAGYTLVRCPDCGLVFQDPQPDAADLEGAYYFDAAFVERLEGDLEPIVRARALEKLALLHDAGVETAGLALDVGCSTGGWLEVASAAGWTATGIEIGPPAAEAARARGFEVHTGTLEQAAGALAGRRFELITFWDVLEHLPDPVGALRRARELLAPGGAVAMTFPNVGGWYPRATYRLIARPTGVWEHPELPVHLYDFSQATAARIVERAGLEPAAARTIEIPFAFLCQTTLADQLTGRRRVLRPVFKLLRAVVYPAARRFDRSNAQFLLAREPGESGRSARG